MKEENMEIKAIYSDEAEKASLGGMLLDAYKVAEFASNALKLKPEAFYHKKHQIIYAGIMRMLTDGRPVDVLTLASRLEGDGALEQVGGKGYLDELTVAIPTVEHAEYYLDLVRQKYILRRITEESLGLESEARTTERGDELLKTVPGRYADIIDEVSRKKTLKSIIAGLIEKWKKAHEVKRGFTGLPTPWASLNKITCGLQPGIYMIAARPSQGKTTVEDQITEFLANQGIPVARATLDMTVERLLARTTARHAGVSLPKLNAGFAGDNQIAKVTEAGEIISEYPMFITDELYDVNAICTWVRAMKIKHNIQLFTLDYVQQVEVVGRAGQYMNENQVLTQVSRKFKRLALELKIPVILLSQLNRGSDQEDRIPTLSDLRGSGSLEQDANMVILLYHDKKEQDQHGKRPQWMDVAKNQDGPTGTLPFWFWANYFRFDEAPVENGVAQWVLSAGEEESLKLDSE
jgi:replicative DNA helicase